MNLRTAHLSNGVTLEYVEQGDISGTPVIFLHGLSDSWKSFEPVLPYLPKNMHAIAVSQRGHGNSDRPLEGYGPKDFASDVALLINHLNLNAAIIAGHSMGGAVAQRMVIDYPEKIKALILIASFASFRDKESVVQLNEAIQTFSDPVDPAFVEEFQRSTITLPLEEAFIQTVVGESLKLPARVWKGVTAGLMDADNLRGLKAVKKPALLVWGD